MPQLLTTNAEITCPHNGRGISMSLDPVLSAEGGDVLVAGDLGTVAGCSGTPMCTTYSLQSMGLNRTTVLGQQAILVTDYQQTDTGMPLTIVETHSVNDDSTAADLPADGSPPSIEPFLLDTTPPDVQAAPPVAVFNTTTMMPAAFPVTFTLSTAFPLRWELRLLNGVSQQASDLTSSSANPVVAPSGGDWSSPTTVVVVTMTADFFTSLSIGLHRLYMIGISKRGLAGYAEVLITVS